MSLMEALELAYKNDLALTLTEAGGMVWISRANKVVLGESVSGDLETAIVRAIVRALQELGVLPTD